MSRMTINDRVAVVEYGPSVVRNDEGDVDFVHLLARAVEDVRVITAEAAKMVCLADSMFNRS